MADLSTGAIVALRQLAKTDHAVEVVFQGFANEPPLKRAEVVELCALGLAEIDGKTCRLTAAGAVKVDSLDDWKELR